MGLEIVIIHILAGAALGLRFKVMILVPAVTLTMLFAAIVGVTRGNQFWSIAVAMILLGTAIQVGYLAGTLIRAKIASVRAQRSVLSENWKSVSWVLALEAEHQAHGRERPTAVTM
jgi:hypothetical protein